MIVDAFFSFVAKVVMWPLTLLPEWSPVDLSGPIAAVQGLALGEWIGWVNNYLPVTHGLTAIGVILVVTNATFIANWVLWLGTKLHLLGGS